MRKNPYTVPLTIDRIDCGAPQGAKRVAMRAQANMQQGQGQIPAARSEVIW